MNYTKNHHLPQWEKTDRIMMEDFNAMCADMEAGLDKTARDAAADTAAARSESAAAAARAQSTADTAVSKADAARAVADAAYCPSFMPYAIGTYRGTGTGETTIRLGFKPRFLIISDQQASTEGGGGIIHNLMLVGAHTASTGIAFLSDGFKVFNVESHYPRLNKTRTFAYVAFR